MRQVYDDRDWLYEEYIVKNKSQREIAKEVDVSPSVIFRRLSKFGIKKPKENIRYRYKEPAKKIEVSCSCCGEKTIKAESYITSRKSKGSSNFYCDQTCFGIAHSENMSGENHPNYGKKGKVVPNDYRTKEQMSEHAKAAWRRHRKTGIHEERIRKLHQGHKKFFETEEGRELRRRQGYLSRKSQRGKESSIERKMREELIKRGIEFEQEYPFLQRYHIDFYIPKYRIAIECDGDYWHNIPKVIEKDKRKNKDIESHGISLYRFWESEINEDVAACVDVVMAEINEDVTEETVTA